jgi:hypothetical protein
MMWASTSFPLVIIMSAISSAMITMYGILSGNRLGFVAVGIDVEALEDPFLAELVVAVEMPHPDTSQQVVSLLHLVHGPGQHRLGLLHVGDHRMHQMRNP